MPIEIKPDKINQNTGDRGSFTQLEENGNKDWARRVLAYVANQPIEVTFESGESVLIYQESNSVAGFATTEVISYEVPVNKKLNIQNIIVSSENKALFTVKVDGNKMASIRTWFSNFNADITLNTQILDGTIIIEVENKSSSTADFNCTLIGRLLDA